MALWKADKIEELCGESSRKNSRSHDRESMAPYDIVSEENPAAVASRGILPSQLENHSLGCDLIISLFSKNPTGYSIRGISLNSNREILDELREIQKK